MRSWLLLAPALLAAQGMRVEPFAAEVRTVHNAASGLLSDDVLSVAVDSSRAAWAATGAGLAQWPYPCSKAATESSPRVTGHGHRDRIVLFGYWIMTVTEFEVWPSAVTLKFTSPAPLRVAGSSTLI